MTIEQQRTETVRIDQERLWASLTELGEVGAYFDAETELMGVRRLALSDEDIAGRHLVVPWFEKAGLEVSFDRIGNVRARRPGLDNTLAPVVIGSHIDSVATAGRFDGCLGVLGGLEVIRTLNDHQVETLRPIELAIWTEEEGCRFGTDMLGSAVAAGRISEVDARALTDAQGISVGSELDRHGLVGDRPVPVAPPAHYVECHIEQGPILEAGGYEIGVVTGVQAILWHRLTIRGRAAHAGTTPDALRHSAVLAASLVTVKLDEMVKSGDYGALLANVGRFDTSPNLVNIVASEAIITVDFRNPDEEAIQRASADLLAYCWEVEERCGVTISSEITAHTPPVEFYDEVMDEVEQVANRFGLSNRRIMSGAGHDAGEMAAICPTGMVFVPGRYDGISHNPREYSTPKACADGINVLLQCAVTFANQE
ncbi:M20 family metallo-hydrolase [Propionimicrobium sp. PCR01-08-3]|uniref:M20 family metallo-hydrolase n=1 Tax=Propionimicrobium sp. PCR01-08-3 TaxID=3052086 RepID=UPI00255C7D7D|nr:M20 family metallo-hydrolase [Propionimicrobium sp. PCR01-08-3]WIY82526.1 M20 family metallo-hydrolase [Propionimicrobium sp. PCR01-08-3]